MLKTWKLFLDLHANLSSISEDFLFKAFIIYLFLERGGRKGEREGEKHPLVASCTHPNWGPNL